MSKTIRTLMLVSGSFFAPALFGACSDSPDSPASTAGTAGTAGTSAGASGSSGSAGPGAAAGSAGSSSGSSGGSGTAGTSGSGGTGGSGGTAGTGDAARYTPTDMIDGRSYAELSAEWWKWFFAIPKTGHPASGGDCATQQSGNVWFLAGSLDGLPTTRECAIPAGKILFFPLTNSICYPCPETDGCSTPKTEADLATCAKVIGSDLSVTLDGTSFDHLDDYHVTSSEFSFTVPTSASQQEFSCTGPIAANTCDIPEGDRFGVSDGYWLALKPLSAGTHTLHFVATNAVPPPFTEDNTFTITVQ